MWQVKSLTFCLAHLFPVKPQVCNAGANCSNPNLILCKIAFVSLVTVDIVNSISRTVVNIIVLCKGPSGLVTRKKKKNCGGGLSRHLFLVTFPPLQGLSGRLHGPHWPHILCTDVEIILH